MSGTHAEMNAVYCGTCGLRLGWLPVNGYGGFYCGRCKKKYEIMLLEDSFVQTPIKDGKECTSESSCSAPAAYANNLP